jgi:hypothetical protein
MELASKPKQNKKVLIVKWSLKPPQEGEKGMSKWSNT